MRLFTLFICITLFITSSCDTKSDLIRLASSIEQDNLSQFDRLALRINLDTCRFEEGRNALHYALEMKADKIANKLITADFMLNETDSLNFTPLLFAIHSKSKEITEKLLEKDVSVDTIDYYNGFSALHYATYFNDMDLVKKLISKKANVNIKTEAIMENTALHIAVDNENALIAQLLLDHNASDTITDANGKTVIDLSTKSKSIHILKLFYNKMSLEKKEKLFLNLVRNSGDIAFLKQILNEKWISKTMLKDAFVFSKDTIVSKILLNKGASIKALHSQYGYAAIHYAAIRGDVSMLKFLLAHGANINQRSRKGTATPLMYAAQLNGQMDDLNKKTQRFNISINVILYDAMGKSVEKTKGNSMETVKYLIANKANVHYKNSINENALYYADASFNHEVSEYLKKANIKETKKFVEHNSDRLIRLMNN